MQSVSPRKLACFSMNNTPNVLEFKLSEETSLSNKRPRDLNVESSKEREPQITSKGNTFADRV